MSGPTPCAAQRDEADDAAWKGWSIAPRDAHKHRVRALTRTGRHLRTATRILSARRMHREQLLEFQARKLRSVIRGAYLDVPYYRRMFDSLRLRPSDVVTPSNLSAIPVSQSQDYRMQPLSETLARGTDVCRTRRRVTSGSSGRPFTVHRSFLEEQLTSLFSLRSLIEFGVRAGDSTAWIRLLSQGDHEGRFPYNLRSRAGWYRTRFVDSAQPVAQILHHLRALAPDVVKGYAGVLAQVAREDALGIHPGLIISGGETLTAERRRRIQSGFGARVLEQYGSHEFNLLAWECRDTGLLHVCDDSVVLEILRDGRPVAPGERGEVVATALHSYTMPFIRYSTGDVATRGPETCPCGLPFSTIYSIQGRMIDYLILPSGRFMHPDRVVVPIFEKHSDWIDQWRLVQERRDRITLLVQPRGAPCAYRVSDAERTGRIDLPADVSFSIAVTREMPQDRRGKFYLCRSMVHAAGREVDWDGL